MTKKNTENTEKKTIAALMEVVETVGREMNLTLSYSALAAYDAALSNIDNIHGGEYVDALADMMRALMRRKLDAAALIVSDAIAAALSGEKPNAATIGSF